MLKAEDEKEKNCNIQILNETPKSIRDQVLSHFLNPRNVCNLSSCSSVFYKDTKNIAYWKDKLIAMDIIKQNELKKVIKANVILNYKKLYRSLSSFKFKIRLSAWQVLCLSGEVAAIKYAFQKEGLTGNTRGVNGENVLHYAALSGSVEAMEEALKLVKPQTDEFGINVLHYAAWSGSVAAMGRAIQLGLSPTFIDKEGANALHFAALSGSVAAMHEAIKLGLSPTIIEDDGSNILHNAAWSGSVEAMREAIRLGISPTSVTERGMNALHFAAQRGSVEAMREAVKQGVSPTSLTHEGANALHYAAWGGSIEHMREALNLGLSIFSLDNESTSVLHFAVLDGSLKVIREAIKLGLSPRSVDQDRSTILHYAAFGGSAEAVSFVRKISYELNLNLEPSERDSLGHDAFWYAKQSKNSDEITKILSLSKDEINLLFEEYYETEEDKQERKTYTLK